MLSEKTKAALIAEIETEHAAFEAALVKISADKMTAPGAMGAWSVKDIVAHIAMWRSRAITRLFKAEMGQPPTLDVPPALAKAEDWVDLMNAEDYQSQKDRPLERVMADFQGSHRQLLKRLTNWRDEAVLFDTRRYAALKGRSLAEVVWADSAEHEAEHRATLEQT